jgi:hypothetical protein
MSKGVVIFAQNNSELDYAKIALFAAKRVREYLDVPVTLITDSKDWLLSSQPEAESVFDQIIPVWYETTQTRKFFDGSLSSKKLIWKNLNRFDAFNLSPYDETLVIDSDYIICSDNLNKVWGSKNNFMIYRQGYDLAQWRDTSSFEYINQYSIPFYWATVFYFRKDKVNQSFFRLVQLVKENWQYYKYLYNIDSALFRNDFAFSIAIHIMNGCVDGNFAKPLPGKLIHAFDRDIMIDLKEDSMKVLIEKEKYNGEYTLIKTTGLDIHMMNKFSLSRYLDGVTYE